MSDPSGYLADFSYGNNDNPPEYPSLDETVTAIGLIGYTACALAELFYGNPGAIAPEVQEVSATVDETASKARVGRWMSPSEHSKMVQTGKVQESATGTTHVALPANRDAFFKQAKPGSIYVEFNIDSKLVKPTQEGWGKIIGPNSLEGRLAVKKGIPIFEMPDAYNIEIKGMK